MSECLDKIQNYLMSGGLFNPELMEHEKVRDMVIECKKEITRLKKALEIANEAIGFYADKENWSTECFNIDDDIEWIPNGKKSEDLWENVDQYGGKRAREAQKQIKELMEG